MTATIEYSTYTNVDASFRRTYQPGDRLVLAHRGQLVVNDPSDLHAIAEQLFQRHNRDDRPDAARCPSMSVGDVIIIGETAVTVDRIGFQIAHPDPDDLITDRTWRTVIDTPAPSADIDR
jgi:hypothetical protein